MSEAGEPWFRLRPSKFMAGIRGLNSNEVKVYFCLVCRIMEHGEPVEDDREILATYCEMRPSSFGKALDRLLRLKKLRRTSDGRITNAYCEGEISWRESYSEKQKRAGKKSAEKRQEKQRMEAASVQPAFNHKDTDTDIENDDDDARARTRESDPHDQILAAAKVDPNLDIRGKWGSTAQRGIVDRWRSDLGLTQPEILDVVADVMAKRTSPPESLAYFDKAMQAHAGRKTAEPLTPTITPLPTRPRTRRDEREQRFDEGLAYLRARVGSEPFDP